MSGDHSTDGTEQVFVTKTMPSEVHANPKKREVEQYVAIFGNLDRVNEITHEGAFAKSISAPTGRLRTGRVPVKYNHTLLVGKMLDAREDKTGLLTVQKYGTNRESDRIFSLVSEGMIPTASFKAMARYRNEVDKSTGQKIRHLIEADLLEGGPVDADLAVNPETRVVSVKGLAEIAGALSSLNSLGYADDSTAQAIAFLTVEELAALDALVSVLPFVAPAVRRCLEAARTAQAEYDSGDAAKSIDAMIRDAASAAKVFEIESLLRGRVARASA